jgi:hypothetical protein
MISVPSLRKVTLVYLLPPHSAVNLARAMIEHQLAPEIDDPRRDDPQNLFVIATRAVARLATSLVRWNAPAVTGQDIPTSATAVSTAGIRPFEPRHRPDDEDARAA